jgi:hypothetical protein
MNILYPLFAMIGLTLFCIARLGYLRFVAVKKGHVDPRFFSLYRGYEEPEKLAAYSRHVVNLFEVPVLFYVLVITAYTTGQTGAVVVGLAWAYFGSRLIHSYVHLTSNVVPVRFRLFVFSMLVLVILWGVVLTGIMRS